MSQHDEVEYEETYGEDWANKKNTLYLDIQQLVEQADASFATILAITLNCEEETLDITFLREKAPS